MNAIEKRIRKRLNGENLIGRFKKSPDPHFEDIRGCEGEQLRLNKDHEIEIPFDGNLVDNEFYSFPWTVDEESGDFRVTGEPEVIVKKDFIVKLLDIYRKKTGGDLDQAINNQSLVLEEVTGAVHTYLYELLQNANDYPHNGEDVRVKFILTDRYLFFLHTGANFDLLNIVGICGSHQGEKSKKKETIGYKGIGFKTVFVKNDYVYLKTADWSLRFDRARSNREMECEEDEENMTPWVYMPWPTGPEELDPEVHSIIDNVAADFRVQFALRHSKDAREHIEQLDKVFGDDEILLFIPHVTDVEVTVDGRVSHHVTKDRNKWLVWSDKDPATELLKWVRNEFKNGNGGKIPPKFKDIDAVQISFAVRKDGKRIVPVENARVYNYLPTELRLGLPFFVNADFIPDASRSGLHPGLLWNDTVIGDCGKYFVKWFASLLETEGEYDMESVFSIYPQVKSTDHYPSLFMNNVHSETGKVACIPVTKDGEYRLLHLKDTIYDLTGLTGCENSVLTDEEFYSFCGMSGCLPHPDIRDNSALITILENHKASVLKFDTIKLGEMIRKPAFKKWLEDREHNIAFLSFLLRSDYIGNYSGEEIILKEDGTLGAARNIYADIDSFMDDLSFLSGLLPRMDTKVREAVKDIPGWRDFLDKFKTFNAFLFIKDDVMANLGGSLKRLFLVSENNFRFLHFMAVQNYELGLSGYPLLNEGGSIAGDDVYVKDEFGESYSKKPWVKKEWVSFLDERYFERDDIKVRQYVFRHGIKNLTPETACSRFVDDNERISYIASCVNKDIETNLDFYSFYATLDGYSPKLPDKTRENLCVFTTDGNDVAATGIRSSIYYPSTEWENVRKEKWLPKTLGRAIAKVYQESPNWDSLKAFFNSKQIVSQFTMSGFYATTLKNNLDEVFNLITDIETSRSFLDFLFRNNGSFFHGEVPGSVFKKIPVFRQGAEQSTTADAEQGVFYHTEEMDELMAQPWYVKDSFPVLDKEYGDKLFDGNERKEFFKSIGLLKLDLKKGILHLLDSKADVIRKSISDRECNVAFHRYLSGKQRLFTEDEYKPVRDLPIFISSPENPNGELADKSENHYLPAPLLSAFIEKDLVPIDILDSVHPDYVTDESDRDYLKMIGNVELKEDEFIGYITGEGNLPLVTEYLSADRVRNLRFWRWACESKIDNKDKNALKALPVLAKDEENRYVTTEKTYLADEYSSSRGSEDLVRQFVSDAQFISPDYMEENDGRDWHLFFRSLGVITDVKEIVFRRVLPHLGEKQYKNTSIVPLLAGYVEDLRSRIRTDEKTKEDLSLIQLKCVDDQFRKPEDVWISGRYFNLADNPLADILPDFFVSEEYLDDEDPKVQRNVKDFMKMLGDTYGASLETLTGLRDVKIQYFLENQADYNDPETHYRIIRDIAEAYRVDKVGVRQKLDDPERPTLMLFSTDDSLVKSTDLTLSSAFNPDCDFMAGGVDEIDYVNERYASLSSGMRSLFTSEFGVIDGFFEDDLKFLQHLRFAEYFWNIYAPSHPGNLRDILVEENLRDLCCIPTVSGLKCPKDLYDYRNPRLQKMVQMIDGKESDLLPSVNLPEWLVRDMTRLGFRNHLYFKDCLRFLEQETTDYRSDVLGWIVDTDDEIIARNQDVLDDFIGRANWINGKKNWVPLKDLVALEYDNKTLRDYFKSNPYICSLSYMPEYKTDYTRLCDIFKIRIVTDHDFQKAPEGDNQKDYPAIAEIRKRILYLAYISDDKNWQDTYKGYCEKLDNADIRTCENISYFYDENIKTDLTAYTDSSEHLWYCGAWNGPMFGDVLGWLVRNLGFGHLDSGYIKNIFFKNFNTILKQYEGGDLPQEFMDYVDEADREGLKVEERRQDERFEEGLSTDAENASATDAHSGAHSEESPERVHGRRNPDRAQEDDSRDNETETEVNGEEALPHSDEETEMDQNGSMSTPTTSTGRGTISGGEIEDEDEDIDDEDEPGIKAEGRSEEPNTQPTRTGSSQRPRPTPAASQRSEQDEESEHEDVRDRMEREWEAKKNAPLTRPSSKPSWAETYVPDTSGMETASKEEFFGDETAPSRSGWTASSKTSQRVNRDLTDAQKNAEKAMDKVDLMKYFIEEEGRNKYSFLWFKYLMELMFAERRQESRREVQIDFSEYAVLSDKIVMLAVPNKTIPSWLDSADHLSMTFIGKERKTINGAVSSRSEDAVWVDVGASGNLGDIAGNYFKVRLNADGRTFSFTDALMDHFSKLGYENEYNLRDSLPGDIRYIYGPPGTGKTHELVRRLKADYLDGDPLADFLVLAPTNRAADEVAERLLSDVEVRDGVYRYGITESMDILSSGHFITRDSWFCTFDGPKILITTAVRFAYDYLDANNPICEWPWNKVYIDEASMIDIATITYILHKIGDSAPITIAGDPHQIQPVEQNDIQPENIYTMVGLDSFAAAMNRPDVTALTVQRRSVPLIGDLVSRFSYDGKLQHFRGSDVEKPLELRGYHNLKTINFIGFKTELFDQVYGIDSIDNSAFHLYSVILAYNFAEYIVSEVDRLGYNEYTIGIVCPFKAQAMAIQRMLENRPVSHDGKCTVKCGTVHKFQGGECDTMIVVLNTPLEVTSGSHVNNPNVINVAISRARDYLFVMIPDHPVKGFFTRDILGRLAENKSLCYGNDIEKMIFGEEDYIARNTNVACHMPVNVFYEPTKKYEVKIDENAIDIQINEDLEEREP